MSELKALVLSASFGNGHHQANEAFIAALKEKEPNLSNKHVDFLSYLSRPERLITSDIYNFWLKYTPSSYRSFYNWTDTENESKIITGAFHWLGINGLIKDLQELQPQVVVSSYPTPTALAGTTRKRLRMDYLNALVVTDYRVHHHWARPEAELLMVANDKAKEQMKAWNIPSENVVVTGIPIAPVYRQLIGADKVAIRAKFNLRPDLPLILISGGGTGKFRALKKVLSELTNLGQRVQVLVMAGGAEPKIEQVGGATIHYVGFTTAFPQLLAASDLVVGKAGGLTVAESNTLGIPMVIHEPIPGQEEYNATFLEQHQAAIWARELHQLRPAVLRALDKQLNCQMGKNAQAISRPDAAKDVANAILKKLGHTKIDAI